MSTSLISSSLVHNAHACILYCTKLTDSAGHAVKENPLLFLSRETDVMAGLNTNDR